MYHPHLHPKLGHQFLAPSLMRTKADITCLQVLLVDSEPKTLALLTRILAGKTFLVVGAVSTGDEAIEAITELEPHLVLIGSSISVLASLSIVQHINDNYLEIGVTVLRDMLDFGAIAPLLEQGVGSVLASPVESKTLLSELFRAGNKCIANLATRCILSFKVPESEQKLRALPSQGDAPWFSAALGGFVNHPGHNDMTPQSFVETQATISRMTKCEALTA